MVYSNAHYLLSFADFIEPKDEDDSQEEAEEKKTSELLFALETVFDKQRWPHLRSQKDNPCFYTRPSGHFN